MTGTVAERDAWRGGSTLGQLRTLTARQFRIVYGDRRVAFFSLLQPVIMLLLFSQVFGRMANPEVFPRGVRYIDYLAPALLVTTAIGSAQGAGLGLVRDMESGMVVRFRSLPVRLPLVLVARSLTDLVRVGLQMLAVLGCALLLLDFRPDGGAPGVLAAMLLSLVVAWSLIWVFLALGAWLRSIEVLASIGFLAVFPLMFASSAFVPLELLPRWLRIVATVNPLTYGVEASRELALGWGAGATAVAAVAASLGLTAVMAMVAVAGFRRPPGEGSTRSARRARLRAAARQQQDDEQQEAQAGQQPAALRDAPLDLAHRLPRQGPDEGVEGGPHQGARERGGKET
ncbi:ABC transporter permease [Streptomyces sedi]|uniref:Transport permease protein n=1 Tax=Streptomyces sedi TaxID=555059 RepID=A0A5C4UQ45_9ACTN|nr:ABC transporter permease [Streptomyces sedi]